MDLKNTENKRKFKLFDLTKEGPGISKRQSLNPSGFKRFFVTYKDNFGKLLYVNMYMVLGNFPVFFLVMVLSGISKLSAYLPSSDLFHNLGAHMQFSSLTPADMSIYALDGLQSTVSVNTPLTYILIGIGALSLFTFGCVNAGTAYILRNMAKGEPVFIWADFWYAIKRNWKQALPFGIIDGLINAILVFNIYTTVMTTGDFVTSMMFWANIILVVLYFFMRCYIYVQMVTFKLSVFKILKNSLIFSLIGMKRNILALLGNAICLIIEVTFFFSVGGFLVPLGVAAPLAILFSTMAYMKVYASYFKIKEIMIDPYLAEHPELVEPEEEVEVIMRDDVTEKERLEEIKRRNGINS